MQVVGEMMMRHVERVDHLTDRGHVGCEEKWAKYTAPCGTTESRGMMFEECRLMLFTSCQSVYKRARVGPCTLGYTNVVAVALAKTAATVRKCAFSPNCWGTGGG